MYVCMYVCIYIIPKKNKLQMIRRTASRPLSFGRQLRDPQRVLPAASGRRCGGLDDAGGWEPWYIYMIKGMIYIYIN